MIFSLPGTYEFSFLYDWLMSLPAAHIVSDTLSVDMCLIYSITQKTPIQLFFEFFRGQYIENHHVFPAIFTKHCLCRFPSFISRITERRTARCNARKRHKALCKRNKLNDASEVSEGVNDSLLIIAVPLTKTFVLWSFKFLMGKKAQLILPYHHKKGCEEAMSSASILHSPCIFSVFLRFCA